MPRINIKPSTSTSSLDLFLKLHRTKPGQKYTHTSIGSPPLSCHIPDDKLEEFQKLYYEHVFVEGKPAQLTEGIKDCLFTPVKIDIDLRYYQSKDTNSPQRIYKMNDIINICELYMEIMEEWIDTPDQEERRCFILEKTHPRFDLDKNKKIKIDEHGNKRVKDGVHIMFPHIITNTFLQLMFRKNLLLKIHTMLDKYHFDNSYSDIFDKCVIDRNNWQMYGSGKSNVSQVYKVTKIIEAYSDHSNDISSLLINEYDNKNIFTLLSVRNHTQQSTIRNDRKEYLAELERKDHTKKQLLKLNFFGKLGDNKIQGDQTWSSNRIRKEFELIDKYLSCLSVDRINNYRSWMEVGWTLYNIDNFHGKRKNKGVCRMLKTWIEWSRTLGSDWIDEPEYTYIETWEKFRNGGLGIASLKLWAKEDNATKYIQVRQDDLFNCTNKLCKSGDSYDIAELMYKMYKDYYICLPGKSRIWYYYNVDKHRWVEDVNGVMLRKKISTEVFDQIKRHAETQYNRNTLSNPNDDDDDMAENGGEDFENYMKILKIASKLKNTSFKKNIMSECEELFHDNEKTFYEQLDHNQKLVGFANGVYDLKNGRFRKGHPEDMISKSTHINYISYNPDAPQIAQIHKFLREVLTITPVRNYVIKLMASFLDGSTRNEKFHVWSGSGSNGKSKLIELLEKCLGDYSCKMNASNLLQKRSAGTVANPELARTRGARFVNCQEPDQNSELNVGIMKELTGGDTIVTRAMYKESFEFKPQFKMILTCNQKPKLPEDDEATWRRVVLVEFISKFTWEPHGEDINGIWIPESITRPEFPIDVTVNENFDDWAEYFMSILIHVYNETKDEALLEPAEVKKYTKEYQQTQDLLQEFINEKIELDESSSIPSKELYSEVKRWLELNYPDERKTFKPSKQKAYLMKKFKFEDRKFKGIRIRSTLDNTSLIDDLDNDLELI